jgi:hypothetical protein
MLKPTSVGATAPIVWVREIAIVVFVVGDVDGVVEGVGACFVEELDVDEAGT